MLRSVFLYVAPLTAFDGRHRRLHAGSEFQGVNQDDRPEEPHTDDVLWRIGGGAYKGKSSGWNVQARKKKKKTKKKKRIALRTALAL
jgi:hypothetical protein